MLDSPAQPLTVGAITDENALAEDFTSANADLIELRLDALGDGPAVLDFAQRHHQKLPLLITARDALEGGLNDSNQAAREKLLRSLLPFASLLDLELNNFDTSQELIADARAGGVKVILSNHDFKSFDHMATIEVLTQAEAVGADIAKAAVTLRDPVDLTLFESLLADLGESSFSLMGMGAYGPVSRVLAAQHGSRLNYGYLGKEATAPGQWPAHLLKEVIAHCPRL